MSLRNLESRLRKLEQTLGERPPTIHIFTVGTGEGFDFSSDEEFQREISKKKYDNAIIIKDLWKTK